MQRYPPPPLAPRPYETSYFDLPADIRRQIQAYPGVSPRVARLSQYGQLTTREQILAECNKPLTVNELLPVVDATIQERTQNRFSQVSFIFYRIPYISSIVNWLPRTKTFTVEYSSTLYATDYTETFNNTKDMLNRLLSKGFILISPELQYRALLNRKICVDNIPQFAKILVLQTFRNNLKKWLHMIALNPVKYTEEFKDYIYRALFYIHYSVTLPGNAKDLALYADKIVVDYLRKV